MQIHMRVVIFACILRLLEAMLALCPRAFLAPDCAGRVFEIISSEGQEDNLTFAQELASPLGELAFTPHMAWTSQVHFTSLKAHVVISEPYHQDISRRSPL